MNKLKFARANTLISYVALIIFIIADLAVNTPAFALASIAVIVLVKLVLLLPVAGVIRGSSRAHAWLCFIMMVYFINGVLRATTPGYLIWGLIEVFLSVEIFISAMLYVRWKRLSIE